MQWHQIDLVPTINSILILVVFGVQIFILRTRHRLIDDRVTHREFEQHLLVTHELIGRLTLLETAVFDGGARRYPDEPVD